MSYTDQSLACRDCGQTFTFTAGEQEFYASRGLTNAPSRCPSCRAIRKAQRGDSGGAGGSYSSGGGSSYSSGGSTWSGNGGGAGAGYSRRPQREMHTIVCSSCGNEAQVPFLPTEGKPVYCSDCYRQQGGGGNRSGGGSRSYGSRY